MTTQVAEPKVQSQSQNGNAQAQTRPTVQPVVEITENESDIRLAVEMPGVDEAHADVSLEKHVLTIRGTAIPVQPKGFELVYSEFAPVNFERSFSVSDEIDSENIEAEMKHGVLSLTLPKSKKAQPHKITIKAG